MTAHDRAFLIGGPEAVGYEDPGGDKARQKRYQIRKRILNGLQDLAYRLMLPGDQRERLIKAADELESDAQSRIQNGLLEFLLFYLDLGGPDLYKEMVSTPIGIAEEQSHLRENNEYRETEARFLTRFADPVPVENLIRRKNDPNEELTGRELLALTVYQGDSAED